MIGNVFGPDTRLDHQADHDKTGTGAAIGDGILQLNHMFRQNHGARLPLPVGDKRQRLGGKLVHAVPGQRT